MLGTLFVFPMIQYFTSRYSVENSYFGQQAFSAEFDLSDFGNIFLQTVGINLLVGLFISIIIGIFIGFGGFPEGLESNQGNIRTWVFLMAGYLMSGLLVTAVQAYWAVSKRNLVANNTHLGELKIHSTMEFWDYWTLVLGNLLVIIVTLGFAYPWARIRLANYHAETLILEGSIEKFVDGQAQQVGAYGEEIADMLDLDLSF